MTIYKFKQSSKLVVFSLFVLSLERFLFYFLNLDNFAKLSFNEIFLSFINGLRVDFLTISTFGAVSILAMLFGFWKFGNRSLFIILYIIFSVNLISIGYFPQVGRHLENEVFLIGNDLNFIFDLFIIYANFISLYALGMLLIWKIWLNLTKIDETKFINNSKLIEKIIIIFIAIILLFLGIRGKISGKPLSFSDNFINGKIQTAHLAVSGTFSILKSKKRTIYNFVPNNEAENIINNLLDNNFSSNIKYKKNIETPNIIILLVESLTPQFIDQNLTPNLYNLKNSSIYFNNFFANGQRSIEGITSILTGIPSVPAFPDLGYGREMNKNINYLGKFVKDLNYKTFGIQGSKRSSFRIDQALTIAGFDNVFGAEDMQNLNVDEVNIKLPFGSVWDGNLLKFINHLELNSNQPFLLFGFTATMHMPFKLPNKKYEIYSHDETGLNGYLNNLYYFDNKLGEFLESCKKQSWFQNTICIITADHVVGNNLFKSESIIERHRIPLYIYAPDIFEPHQIDKIASQSDIFPTIIKILKNNKKYNLYGNSLLNENEKNSFAFLREGDQSYLLKKDKLETLNESLELKALIQMMTTTK